MHVVLSTAGGLVVSDSEVPDEPLEIVQLLVSVDADCLADNVVRFSGVALRTPLRSTLHSTALRTFCGLGRMRRRISGGHLL